MGEDFMLYGGSGAASPADSSRFEPERSKFVPPDAQITGKSVVIPGSPSIPFEPLVPMVPAPPPTATAGAKSRCITELLDACMGRTVRVTAAIGAKGDVVEKVGVLVFACHGHIAIRGDGGRNLLIFDLDAVKIVEIYDAC